MKNKPYYLKLYQSSLTNEEFSCTGNQALIIVRAIERILPGNVWYAADLNTNNAVEEFKEFSNLIPQKVGTGIELIRIIGKVDQFLSGVLLLVPSVIDAPKWREEFIETEAPYSDSLGDAIIEIRMFDTTYFEIYCADNNLIKKIKNELNLQ